MNKRKIATLLIIMAFIVICVGIYFVVFKKEDGKELSSNGLDASVLETHSIKYEINSAESISSTNGSCLVTNGKCMVVTPNIVAKEGYKVVGWSKNSNATTKDYNINEEIDIKSNIVLYAITIKNSDFQNGYDIGNTCNVNKCSTGIMVADIACSQIGYIEKASDSNLDSCTDNKGDNNYNKYGNSGNAWSAAFVNWSFEKSKVSLIEKGIKDVDNIDSYIEWAKEKNIWYTSKSSLHNGDIIVADNSIGIAIEQDGIWNMVLGNKNNEVRMIEPSDINGFISMKGMAY